MPEAGPDRRHSELSRSVILYVGRVDAGQRGKLAGFSLRSAAASMSATATFGSEVVFAILSRAAACRAWKRFCNTITVVRDVYCISERTLIPFPSESTKVYKKRDTSELLPSV